MYSATSVGSLYWVCNTQSNKKNVLGPLYRTDKLKHVIQLWEIKISVNIDSNAAAYFSRIPFLMFSIIVWDKYQC